ncbi:putative alpha-acetyltransferase 35, NatC auxiliary subunit [Plasmopara halstedii]
MQGTTMSDEKELQNELKAKINLQSMTIDPEWKDVTQLMSAAAKEFKVGQLIHEGDFNLFESMSALELMDPKMDSGMSVNGIPPQSISARLASGSVQLNFSSARDVLATLDRLFCCEAGWLNGLPLAQSLLTSIYMHREPLNALCTQLVTSSNSLMLMDVDVRLLLKERLRNTAKDSLLLVMVAVTLATLKTANLVREATLRADIYEEEDFSPGKGFDAGILTSITVEAVDTLLQVTQERMETILLQHKASSAKKMTRKKQGKRKSTTAAGMSEDTNVLGYEMLHSNVRINAMLCEAFIRRLQLQRKLLNTYAEIGLAEGPLDLQKARNGFHCAYELVQGLLTERLELDPECFNGKAIGFDPSISRLLLSGSPPRDIQVPSFEKSLSKMKKIMEEMQIGCSPPEWRCMEDLRIFLIEFSRRQPTLVARSYVLLFLYADGKMYAKYNFMDWLSASMVINGVPSVLLSTQEGILYTSRCIETVYESLKVYLHNRSRQRPRIESLLDEWSILQAEATAVDERFTTEMNIPHATYPRYFTAWSLEESVQLMLHYVVLGLELELYAPPELGMVYWYLDYLQGSRLQNLNVTWTFVEKMKEVMPSAHCREPRAMKQQQPSASGKSIKKSKAKHKKKSASVSSLPSEPAHDIIDPTKARFFREFKYTELLRSLMRAYFQLFNALEREGLVEVKLPVYSSYLIRFQHRFAAFQKLPYPAALTFEEYRQNSDFSPYDLELIYKSAEECFNMARGHAEALLSDEEKINRIVTIGGLEIVRDFELQSLLKVCISCCVHLSQRTEGKIKMKTSKEVHLDFSVHPHFPVVEFSS